MNPNSEPPSYQMAIEAEEEEEEKIDFIKKPRAQRTYLEILRKHEISDDFAKRLQKLHGFKIVFILDDSGSMNTILQDSPLNTSNSQCKATRWDELQSFANISIEVATLFDENGCDVYFLNRTPIQSVKNSSELTVHFRSKPNGFTPLAKCLNTVLSDNTPVILNEKKLLIIIATDGEPTDQTGKADVAEFKRILKSRGPRVFTTIVVCTDDEESVKYLNKWDRNLPNLDVVDDYRNERSEIRRAKGSSYSFSFGDYVVKSLIGSIDPELDQLDESNCCISF